MAKAKDIIELKPRSAGMSRMMAERINLDAREFQNVLEQLEHDNVRMRAIHAHIDALWARISGLESQVFELDSAVSPPDSCKDDSTRG